MPYRRSAALLQPALPLGTSCWAVTTLQSGCRISVSLLAAGMYSLLDMLLWCRAITAALLKPEQDDPAASERARSYPHLLLLLLQGGGYPTALTLTQWS